MSLLKKICSFAAASLIALSASAMPSFAEELPSGTSYDDIGKVIESFYEEKKEGDGGVAVSVFGKDDIIYSGYFGYSDKENNIPFDENVTVEWGSVTKLTVWVSAMQLKEKGLLDLDEDIQTYLPDNFLKRLRYDEPITFMNLMNHNAGFEDVYIGLETPDENDYMTLEDALARFQPAQIYRPGEIVAYSNWGAALAGYIVERVSGQKFCDYVHENIFKPLGMENSALDFDLSDDPAVQEKRREMKSYLPNGTVNPQQRGFIYLYPAGMCTSTMADFMTFGQALMNCDERLLSKESFEELYTPTTVFDNGFASNYHGFWCMFYAKNPVIGHNGGTNCCSTTLVFDREENVGLAILTNQPGEGIFNGGIPELVFGEYQGKEPLGNITESGIYKLTRAPMTGPSKIASAIAVNIITEEALKSPELQDQIAVQSGDKIRVPSVDLVKMSTGELVLNYGSLALWIITAVICGIFLIVKFFVLILGKKSINPMKTWHNVMTFAVLASMADVLLVAATISLYSVTIIQILSVFALAVAVVLTVGIIYGAVTFNSRMETAEKAKRRMSFRNICMMLFCIISLFNLVFWELCYFWLV